MGTFDGADWPGLVATVRSLPLEGVAAADWGLTYKHGPRVENGMEPMPNSA